MVDEKLLSKLDYPASRYTSYPTVPYWQTEPILENGFLPIEKGHLIQVEEQETGRQIRNILCQYETSWDPTFLNSASGLHIKSDLIDLENDGLIRQRENGLEITHTGKSYLRNICLIFDDKYRAKKPVNPLFSKSI